MKSKFKKVFRFFFFIISAIVFLFLFFPERCFGKRSGRAEKVVQRKRQSILKKRVYYTKEIDKNESVEE
ncbi:MAG: hypothetical protein IJ471_07175 [Eubacterium sp.]|nr:hypothetical protein [Eubacterium sp.]